MSLSTLRAWSLVTALGLCASFSGEALAVHAASPIGDAGSAYGVTPIAYNNYYWLAQETDAAPTVADAEDSLVEESSEAEGDDEDDSLADRLAALEEKYAELDEAQGDLSSSLKDYAKTGHGGATMKVNGRVHFDMWGFPGDSPGVNGFESGDNGISPQDRVGFRRMRFGVKGDLWKNMLYKIEMEFAGGNKSEFRDAYLGFTELPFLQTVLIGNQKRPYGLDHLNSSRYNVFIERPFVIEAFNQDARRLGICSYGISDDLAWNWRYGVYNQRLVQDEGNYISDHYQAQVAGRLANTIWHDECSDGRGYAHWAISGTWADADGNAAADNFADSGINEARFRTRPEARTDARWLDTGHIADTNDYGLLGLESVVNVGAAQWVGEYQFVSLNRSGANDLNLHGGYFYLSYFLTGEHIPWNRKTGCLGRVKPFENFFLVDTCCDGVRGGWGAWQLAARYSYLDLTDDDIQGGIGESVTAGVNWHWNPWARMQFNYIYGNIWDNAGNAAGGVDFGDYHILGARFMVDF